MRNLPRIVLKVSALSDWWSDLNESQQWQDRVFYSLCAAFSVVSVVALIQLIRIQRRVPEYGWTTQKIFHLMNFIVNGARAVVFGFHAGVFLLKPKVFTLVLLNLPGLLFFSTYTLLVLFWAEIYHQARSLPTDKLKAVYISVNSVIYFIQVCIWIYLGINDNSVGELIGNVFIAVVSFIAALGFVIYGGRLFFMLRRFPIESKGRRKKLHEVGSVTAICFTCFLIRCFVTPKPSYIKELVEKSQKILICNMDGMYKLITLSSLGSIGICFLPSGAKQFSKDFPSYTTTASTFSYVLVGLSAFDSDASLEVLDHPILDLIYYTLTEILPSALVLYILRKLPPRRVSAQYHPIR